jgi:hypothetical protein
MFELKNISITGMDDAFAKAERYCLLGDSIQAMQSYEKAESLRPEGNDSSILRWNSCVRLLQDNEQIKPNVLDSQQSMLE